MLQFVSLLCDTEVLNAVFSQLGFTVVVHNNLTAEAMRHEIQQLGTRNFMADDALVSSVTHIQSCNICDYCIYIFFYSLKESVDILEITFLLDEKMDTTLMS